ncbi:NAD-dependent epimerase/dehydratase family protein [Ilumatobacter sp.]|uniref:NAD-dependent epimerase/dehydratase family protein n=2 Tax=Ilumatobacter sp. TaxID=1967498 RepID=UPI0037511328
MFNDGDTSMTQQLATPDVTVITGAGGWLGTGLVAAFLSDDHEYQRAGRLRLLVRDPADAVTLDAASDRVEVVVGDISRADTALDLFRGLHDVDSVDVIHTAGIIHPNKMADFDAVNHQGTEHILRAAENAGIRRMVHVSSNSPFGTNADVTDTFGHDEPFHPYFGYGRSKMDAELRVHDAVDRGLNVVMVRPPWFYGPHQPARQTTFFTLVRTGRFPVLGGGNQRRSMVFIDNLIEGIVRAELTPTAPGLGWWIADERAYTVSEIVETVGCALTAEGYDVKANRLKLPNVVGDIAERVDAFFQRIDKYNQQFHVLGEMNKTIAVDISAAQRDLGYSPDVSLSDGMRRSIQWCREQGIEL